jgi:hypothetical protein
VFHTGGRDSVMAAMTSNPIRPWTARAVGRSPLTRVADRVEAWAVVAAFVLLVAAVIPALAVGQVGYEARAKEIAADASSRHPVEATALRDSTSEPSIAESTATTFMANLRWSAQNTTHEIVTKVDGPVKAGDHVQIWVTGRSNVTAPPPTDSDAHTIKIGTVALIWLALAALILGSYAMLRIALNRVRDRRWDRGWRGLVENGGGSATFRP